MKKFETFYTPLFLALPFLIVIVAMFAYFIKTYPVLLEKEKNAQLVSEPQKILETDSTIDLSKIKTYEEITQDITKVGQKPADKEIVYFENEKKEIFAKYGVGGAVAVAKFAENKWIFLQAWNGSPDCLIFDKAGVPYFKSTIEFACQIDGNLRAESNSADKKSYDDFWSR